MDRWEQGPSIFGIKSNVLDRNNMKGNYLVMDNAPIHTPVKVRELVESRGYNCLYLPSYCPFLNLIEEFWSKVKGSVRRNALTLTIDWVTVSVSLSRWLPKLTSKGMLIISCTNSAVREQEEFFSWIWHDGRWQLLMKPDAAKPTSVIYRDIFCFLRKDKEILKRSRPHVPLVIFLRDKNGINWPLPGVITRGGGGANSRKTIIFNSLQHKIHKHISVRYGRSQAMKLIKAFFKARRRVAACANCTCTYFYSYSHHTSVATS
jgi:transposase